MSASFATRGLVLTEHEFAVPLDHARPDGERITVFAREVADPDGARPAVPRLPPGRPGQRGAAARPATRARPAGWTARCSDFRVLMLDQRGTGRSTPGRRAAGSDRRASRPTYLTHFRADAIVRDAELDPPGARRRALERARAELRRVLRHAPTCRSPPRACARRSSPAGCRRSGRADRRRLPRDLRAHARAQPALLRALPRRPRARARAARPPRRRGRPPAVGRPAHRRGGLRQLGDLLGHERRRRGPALHPRAARSTRPPSCTTSRRRSASRATRSTRSLHEAC